VPRLRSPDHTAIIQDLRERVGQLRQLTFRHERQIARLEERATQSDPASDPSRDRLDAYVGHALPLIVLGVVAGAIVVVSFFTVERWQMQLLVLGLVVVGSLALVAVQWLRRRRANAQAIPPRAEQARELGLYVLGIGCLVTSTIVISLD
jgi:hypothetical protein